MPPTGPPEIPPGSKPADEAPGWTAEFIVCGVVTWSDGEPITGVAVRAVDQDLRRQQPLGPYAPGFGTETRTDRSGYYEIVYTADQFARAEDDTADLIVRVIDSDGVRITAHRSFSTHLERRRSTS